MASDDAPSRFPVVDRRLMQVPCHSFSSHTLIVSVSGNAAGACVLSLSTATSYTRPSLHKTDKSKRKAIDRANQILAFDHPAGTYVYFVSLPPTLCFSTVNPLVSLFLVHSPGSLLKSDLKLIVSTRSTLFLDNSYIVL